MSRSLKGVSSRSGSDIFYRDPALFKSQTTVDRYLEDIAITLRAERSELMVTAALKGLITGNITIHHRDGSVQTCTTHDDAILIPDVHQINSVDVSRVSWVLVIEKEASFRSYASLLSSHHNNAGGCLITAKGYPDQITKAFVHMLGTAALKNGFNPKPVYVLVDLDPDGYGIYSCYDTDCQYMRLLGLTFDQLRVCNSLVDTATLCMTARDRTRAKNMLKRSATNEQHRNDLQRMLCLHVKFELQHLSDKDAMMEMLSSGIIEWQG